MASTKMASTMRSRWVVLSSTALGIAVAVALIFRPSRSIQPELPAPAHIPEGTRVRLKERMERHVARMGELMSRLVVLDYDGAARAAGRSNPSCPTSRGCVRRAV